MENIIVGGMVVLIVLVVALAFLMIQMLNTTRKSVESAKDVMADRALHTMEEISELDKSLQAITEQQEEAQQLGRSLRDLLQGPKFRGNYGETILEELLERVLPRGIWERQYTLEGAEKVDCIVRLKDVIVPIDSKFPRDAYLRYMEAETDEERTSNWKQFEASVKVQIGDIQRKYIKPELGTTEFALMFIPSEAIYYETIAESNYLGQPSSILEYAQERRVIPVSPNTFYAFLQVVVIAMRNVEVIKAAETLRRGLTDLQKSFDSFYEKYEEVGRGIVRAADAYRVGDGHLDRYKRRLDSTLQLEVVQEAPPEEVPEPTVVPEQPGPRW